MKSTCILAACLLVAASAGAQPERPADNATAARIADGVKKAEDGKLLDAVEQFQRVLDTAGDELVPVDRSQHTLARWVVHGYLARLPAEGVKLYRQRVDGQATKRLDEAKKSRDDVGLHRLLADMFTAKATEEAILELARRSFERGDFDAAEHFWRMLLPPLQDDERILRFPDPKTTPAAIQSRLILVKLFRGERDEAKEELKALRDKSPEAAGLLAGKTGKYVDTLTEMVKDPKLTTLQPIPDAPDWPTFAGSPTRTGTNRAKLPYFWPDVATWKSPLPFVRVGRLDSNQPDALHPRALAFYPIVTDGRGYLAGGNRILSINLQTGQLTTADWIKESEEARMPNRQDIRYTLTADDGMLYARMGPTALKVTEGADRRSFIFALGARKANTEAREGLWRIDPPAAEGSFTHFEGTPVVQSGRVYAAFWRQAGAEATAGIACYRIDDPKALPELVWQRVVGKAGSEPNGETRYRHSLVTLSGPNVVYCTDGGTVIALDALSGKPQWEYRYPRNERAIMPRYRDLCPPLADGGRIYAAPADTDRLLCIDAFTGHLIWEREGVEVIHLLGVARGRLIATFGGPVRGIRGLNLRTGADSGPNGWTIHDDGGEATFGRGLVTEEAVVWPTRHGLHFIDPSDGTPLRSPIPGPFGNLCYADGVLLVTTATEVWGFVSEAKKLGDRRKAVEADPDNPANHADLAQSLIDAGKYAEAEAEAAKAGVAKDRLRWLLAEKVIRDGDRAGATRLYEELAKGEGSFAAAGAVRLAEMCQDPTKVREAWRAAFAKRATIRDEHGVPWPSWTYAENKSPDPLVMRLGVRDDDFRGLVEGDDVPKLPPTPGYLRQSHSNLDEPFLRILGTSDEIVAVGERGYVIPKGTTFTVSTPPTVVASNDSDLILAWPRRIECRSIQTGDVRWKIDYQPDGPILNRLTRATLPAASGMNGPATLKHFRLTPQSAAFIYGEGIIVEFAPWFGFGSVRTAPGDRNSRFHPMYSELAQTTDGRMSLGRTRREFPCSRKPWPEPPIQLKSDEYLLAGDGALVIFNFESGKELARYTLPGPESLTGELPRFRMHQGDPLVIVERNHGVEIERLKIDGLKRAWAAPLFVGRTLDDVAFIADRLVTATDGLLVGRGWKDGQQLWEAPLPEAPNTTWKLAVSPQGLLAYPAEAFLRHPNFDAVGEFRRAGWDRAALLRAMSRTYDVWADRELPVLVIDPVDGRLVQRLTFPAAGPAAGVAVTSKGVVVVTGKGSWTLTGR